MINSVRQGATFDFEFDISGDDVDAFSASFVVKQYPDDAATISRALTWSGSKFIGSLTGTETAALAVGQWFIHMSADDTDEALRQPIKLYISKGWV